jgi:hypothetical protein
MAIVMTVPLFCACLILLGRRLSFASSYISALCSWFFISGLIVVGMTELESVAGEFTTSTNLMMPYYLGYLLAILASIGVINSNDYNKTQKLVLLFALTTFIISCHIALILPDASSLIYATLTIATFSFLAMFVASVHQRRLFNWLLFFIGIRFLILYFQALGGLATTGIGLIISGVIIVGMAYYWNKYRSDIAQWIERWMQ